MRKMVYHEFKIGLNYFDDVKAGEKFFAVRYDDRCYAKGHNIRLREWENGEYTGRECVKQVIYVLRYSRMLKEGYVGLGVGDVCET